MSESCCHGECEPVARPAAGAHASHSAKAWRLGISAGAVLAGIALAQFGWLLASVLCSVVAIGVSIAEPAQRAWRSLGVWVLDINVLMLIAVAGAVALGDWLEAASVLTLFGVAQWLESRSHERAQRAIGSLFTLAPSQALVRRDGRDQLVDVAHVRVGEVVIVRPGERLPLDGVVVQGLSAVNQAPVTGESLPVDKSAGDAVFAGSVNGTGALDIEVSRPSSDSTVARIARLVDAARRQRAPIQTFVDTFARRYTPAVVVLAVLVAVVPPLVTGATAAAFGIWLYRALTLVVVACPCALVISTPVSIVSALTAAAREGVLVKGGSHLERLGSIRCVAFDKTGTLTHGAIAVTDVFGADGMSAHGVLAVAAALESRSEHPIGRAIVNRAIEHGLSFSVGEDFRALPGLGAEGRVAQLPAIIGNHRLFEERQLCTPWLHDHLDRVAGGGGTAVLVGHAGLAVGVIGLADRMRSEGRDAVAQLRREGVSRIVLLSGDNQRNADAAMASTGVDEVYAELMPEEKAGLIATLRERYGPVAMVGDGINDAPALAAADVGIAMGAGTDVALETADVALMSENLSKISYALRLGRATLSNIRTNVALAIGIKVAFIVLAAAGMATLWMAVLADTGASLLVTANSLRLLKVRG